MDLFQVLSADPCPNRIGCQDARTDDEPSADQLPPI